MTAMKQSVHCNYSYHVNAVAAEVCRDQRQHCTTKNCRSDELRESEDESVNPNSKAQCLDQPLLSRGRMTALHRGASPAIHEVA